MEIYFIVFFSGLSFGYSSLIQLGKYDSKRININDYIYFDLSEYKPGDNISLILYFNSYENSFKTFDFYINYCETESSSNYTTCTYISKKQKNHYTKDLNKKDDDDDYEYDDDDYDYDDDDYDYDDDDYDDDDYDYDDYSIKYYYGSYNYLNSYWYDI